jgi:hypothetical protein
MDAVQAITPAAIPRVYKTATATRPIDVMAARKARIRKARSLMR